MIFRQLFDSTSGTYSYLLASRRGGEALIIDPVLEKVDRYLKLMEELDLHLVKAVDTHLHADHVTGLGALRDRTHCITVMGEHSKVDVVSMRIGDGDRLAIEGSEAGRAVHAGSHGRFVQLHHGGPGVHRRHAADPRHRAGPTSRTRDSRAQYESLQRLLKLPEETLVFPAHDYKGDTVSTIGEEKRCNPRLQVKGADEYAALMASLNLPNPKMMDVAVPANLRQGFLQADIARRGWAVCATEAQTMLRAGNVVLVDLRETIERDKHGVIPGSVHTPYSELQRSFGSGAMLEEFAAAAGKPLLFLCAFGERSAMAVQRAQEAGLASARHVEGGMAAMKLATGA